MTYCYKFTWPAQKDTHTVQVTGNFDNWGKNFFLSQHGSVFEGTVQIPNKEKLVFKFVINHDQWVISPDYDTEFDENGIENNVLSADKLIKQVNVPATPAAKSRSPVIKTAEANDLTSTTEASSNLTTANSNPLSPKIVLESTTASKVPEFGAKTFVAEAPTTAEPAPTTAEPAPTTAEPAPTTAEPAPTTAEPAPTTAEPAPTTAEQAPTTVEPAPTKNGDKPEVDSSASPLTHVETTSSSFAGISISQDSGFEHLDATQEGDKGEDLEESNFEEDDNQFKTPTSSNYNSKTLNSTDPNQSIPGSFPIINSSPSHTGEKEVGFIAKFKNLFRY